MSSLLSAELARGRVDELRAAAERANGRSASDVAVAEKGRSRPRRERLRAIVAAVRRSRGGVRAGYWRGERAGIQ
jgi:hypothetical protein